MIKYENTSRGFVIGKFKDRSGLECSIQESSLATEAAIWLGVSDAKPEIMASQASQFGIVTNETTGWVPYPIPEEVLLHTRMELTVEGAKALIEALQFFVDTEELPRD
jgi:hypothetical protein